MSLNIPDLLTGKNFFECVTLEKAWTLHFLELQYVNLDIFRWINHLEY